MPSTLVLLTRSPCSMGAVAVGSPVCCFAEPLDSGWASPVTATPPPATAATATIAAIMVRGLMRRTR
ncbi:hypothetical protein SXANM310S_04604 [Streptomyces xanthochromogenes]